MLLSSKSRQASVSHLASSELEVGESNGRRSSEKLVFGCKSKHELKMARSKRCKSLLMLSAPFSSSTSSMKSSLMSLLNPNTNHHHNQQEHNNNNYHSPHLLSPRHSSSTEEDQDEQQQQQQQQMRCQSLSFTPPNQPASININNNNNNNNNGKPVKCVKMKLFEQPLDKLFSPKAMKQLNNAIKASNSPAAYSSIMQNKRKRSSSSSSSAAANTTTAASLREFSSNSSPTDANNNSNNLTFTSAERQQLLLSVLPEPIRNLLNELYLRGPSTIGIFRKSPNAKHCKELRQKLESDSQSSVQQFQVTVIASVFKEWLRSLPDCLLMSRLYPQWIDVAKLIEPLYQHQLQRHQSQLLDDSFSDSTINGNTSLRPSRSPLTDNGQALDRAHSCSTMISDFSINKMNSDSDMQQEQSQPLTLTEFALSERHSECLRIVRQLLDALNETNLILLRLFICVLWNIANNSEHNKMSANNLGVCVGQSLLNDEHQSSGKSGTSTFSKRHSRSRSQCLLSSTLSLTSPSLQHTNSSYLDSSSAQETAKYVPMLVAFIIENAPALFGKDIIDALALKETHEDRASEIKLADRMVKQDLSVGKENQTPVRKDHVGLTHTTYDSSTTRKDDDDSSKRQHLVIESRFLQKNEKQKSNGGNSNTLATNLIDTDASNTTSSVFIVNPPKRTASSTQIEAQQRPLSATESTSSSRASSSTSGVHSESPAFSSEIDSQNTQTTASSSSPSPSSVSSPSSGLSRSPAQNGRDGIEDEEDERREEGGRIRESTGLESHNLSSKGQQLSLDTPDGSIGSLSNASDRYQNHRVVNRYSTFMGVLNRVPKIPVQFTTSSYGGEAVIYNPNPRQLRSNDDFTFYSSGSFDRPDFKSTSMPNDESVISVKPIYTSQQAQQPQSMQQSQKQQHHHHHHHQNIDTKQYHTIATRNQQELRQQRLKEFLAHQSQHQHHHSFVQASQASYLPQSSYVSTIVPARHQQAAGGGFVPQTSGSSLNYLQQPNAQFQLRRNNQPHPQQHQIQHHPIFYSTTNLSSLQQLQQQDRYLLYHRASLNPQRSHVMSLRDYYLSLQQQNQQRQQQQQQHSSTYKHHQSHLVSLV